jgi:hypothetical protein
VHPPPQVLAMCLGRGPLLLPYAGFWQFCGALMLPVIPRAAFKTSGGAGLQQGEQRRGAPAGPGSARTGR